MLDKVVNGISMVWDRFAGQKMLAFGVGTMMLWFGKIDGQVWELITIAFIGSQAAQDTAIQWKHGPNKNVATSKVVPAAPADEKGP